PLDDVALERADVEAMARQDVDRGGRRHGAHCKLVAGKLIVAVKGDKQSIRERVWALLERRRAGRFPFPLAGRLPNFRGAEAATIAGASKLGEPVTPAALGHIDLIVAGSVAVTAGGARLGKGGGYSDLEFGLARAVGSVDETTPVLTTVHELQVLKERIPMT